MSSTASRAFRTPSPLTGSGERGRIYVVEPLGPFEDDPNVTDKRFPGNPTQSYRTEHPLRPERICRELTAALPPDAVLVSDTGHSGIWTGAMVDLQYPTQRYIRCAGSLGWAFPAALGVKAALPDRPVLCFTGDGGFYYHLAELETAARHRLNAVILVNNNRSLLLNAGTDTVTGGKFC